MEKSLIPPSRGSHCEKCGNRGLELRLQQMGDGSFKQLCFDCRKTEKLARLFERREEIGKKITLLLGTSVQVPEKLGEADEIRLKGVGVVWS